MIFRMVQQSRQIFYSVLSQFTHLTDRQTDGWTDTFLITSPRWHSMQCGKKLLVYDHTDKYTRTA